jgi:glycosyltransferase involved in cell wall biosynthesis
VRDWACLQIGARDHYLVARALHRQRRLAALVTDYWARVPVGFERWSLLRRSRERAHEDLADARIVDFAWKTLAFEAAARLRGVRGWERICRRNAWFQARAAKRLRAMHRSIEPPLRGVFSYSYGAGEPFRVARELGLGTLLGQIDAGPVEEDIVAAAHENHAEYAGAWQRAPALYWEKWREEIRLSDRILVNSGWSRRCLVEAGVDEAKIAVIPLAYEAAGDSRSRSPRTARAFSKSDPMKVLFLGQVALRKGIAELLEAMDLMGAAPVELTVAGPIGIRVPQRFLRHPKIRWMGPVPRGQARPLYRNADVFILPTLSDGFAITQLEALGEGLPVIASRNCGDVVLHGENGLRLDEVSAPAIAEAVLSLARDPDLVARLSRGTERSGETLEEFAARLAPLLSGNRAAAD